MECWLVIGISGVTCGGKTTLAKTLEDYLLGHLNRIIFKDNITLNKVVSVNQDDYFLPVDDPRHTKVEKLNHINFDILTALDMDRMCQDIVNILGNKFVLYNCNLSNLKSSFANDMAENGELKGNIFRDHFMTNYLDANGFNNQRAPNLIKKSRNESFHNINIKLNVLIIEGFLIFNHPFTLDLCNIKFHLHLPYEKCYARRMSRSYDPPDVVGYFEMCVWPFYEQHSKEFKDRNDIFVLNGDVCQQNIFNYVLNCIKDVA